MCCCKVESIVNLDDRGQVVLPKEVREKANIRTGDKLAIVNMDRSGKTCCIILAKADDLAEKVKQMLGPLVKDTEFEKNLQQGWEISISIFLYFCRHKLTIHGLYQRGIKTIIIKY
jgi:AbrB family looped-hinge helix DNA binding protein